MRQFLFTVVIVLVLALIASLRYMSALSDERDRLSRNQTVLLESQHEYKFRDSLNAVSVGMLTVKVEEFRRGFEQMESIVRDMDIKLRRVENISQTAFESRYEIAAKVRDTLLYYEGGRSVSSSEDTLRPARTIRFRNAHIELEGLILDSLFHGSVITYDSLTQVVHRIPRRFLFIRWGTKELRQEIVSSNPHTSITYNRTIRIR